MAKFTVEIDCDNAAFDDDPAFEILLILGSLARMPSEHLMGSPINLFDSNGNRVGKAIYRK